MKKKDKVMPENLREQRGKNPMVFAAALQLDWRRKHS